MGLDSLPFMPTTISAALYTYTVYIFMYSIYIFYIHRPTWKKLSDTLSTVSGRVTNYCLWGPERDKKGLIRYENCTGAGLYLHGCQSFKDFILMTW